MKQKPWILGALAVVAIAQLAVPANMILRRERTLSEGEAFNFRTRPVDPYDAFRGRYVWLAVEGFDTPLPDDSQDLEPGLSRGRRIYASLERDDEGLATIADLSFEPPSRKTYLKTKVAYTRQGRIYLEFPLDRYYMPEDLAPRAETAYREHSRSGVRDAYIRVRVHTGQAVIEDLYVGGKPIRTYLEEDDG